MGNSLVKSAPKANTLTDLPSPLKKTISVTSGSLEDSLSFRWKIENFEVIKATPVLFNQQSFTFEVGQEDSVKTEWCCELFKEKDKNDCGIFLRLKKITCLSPPEVKEVCASFVARMIKPNGETYKTWSGKPEAFEVNSAWGFSKCFSDENEASLKKLIWKDGSFVLELDCKVFTNKPAIQTMDLNEKVRIFEKNTMQNFINMMPQFIEEESNMKDMGKVKVVSKDKMEFKVIPAILSARSPVFKVMFSSGNWKEGQSSEGDPSLVLTDLSGKTVKVLLNYMCGRVLLKDDWKDEDVILELTWAAEKYQLEDLTKFLDKVLAELPLKSIAVIWKLAVLTKRLGMKNAETGLLEKLKKEAINIDQLLLDKDDILLEV